MFVVVAVDDDDVVVVVPDYSWLDRDDFDAPSVFFAAHFSTESPSGNHELPWAGRAVRQAVKEESRV